MDDFSGSFAKLNLDSNKPHCDRTNQQVSRKNGHFKKKNNYNHHNKKKQHPSHSNLIWRKKKEHHHFNSNFVEDIGNKENETPTYKEHKFHKLNDHPFDVKNLRLQCCRHRSRFHLSLPPGCNSKIFYDELPKKDRRSVNSLLYHLWDKYQPTTIDTNCGDRSFDGLHCKLIYDGKEEQYINLLNTVKLKQNVQNQELINKYIHHFGKTWQNYANFHKITEVEYAQKDLDIYSKFFQQNENKWFPKRYYNHRDDLKLKDVEICCNKILFDVNQTEKTSLYLQYVTNDKTNQFKMINYEDQINGMIDTILNVINCLKKRTKEQLNYLKTMTYITDRIVDNKLDWFCLNIEIRKNEQRNVVIIVSVEVTIINYLYFVYIYKQKWLKHQNNARLFVNWWQKYCKCITSRYLSYKTEGKRKRDFKCKEKIDHDAICWTMNIE